ncbi:MAG: hypothetical protein B7Z37_20305 [Verrucomicrobia bacterium 12-59-8]|nr:MAG: hypothetical protein B7Z37_20305 [Verrucomicrobia bacterium 12-59-8]
MEDYVCRTPAQKAAEAAYKDLIKDHAKSDLCYDLIPKTQGGSIISTDLARHLDPAYDCDSKVEGRKCDLAPSWEHAWRYAQGRLEREVAQRGRRRKLRLMSGGWGSGKTYALERLKPEDTFADLVWDGTLGDLRWARETIEKALAAGWQVSLLHVHRNVELALYGAIERGNAEGRSVPLEQLPANHRKVQKVVGSLLRLFGSHPSIYFTLVHNTGTRQVPGNPLQLDPEVIALGGALHYSLKYERYHAKAAEKIHRPG